MDQENFKLSIDAREKFGKGPARLLRRNGMIPAVIYGGNTSSTRAIALSTKEISKRLHSKHFMTTVLTLDLNGSETRVLPKEYQLDPVSDTLIHIDFLQVFENSTVSVQVPVRFFNDQKSPGLKQGGTLNIICHEIALLCPANDIPDSIKVDLDGLKIGDSAHINDISLPKGTSSVSQSNFTIATITAPTSDSENEQSR